MCLVRVLLRKQKIVILDEASSRCVSVNPHFHIEAYIFAFSSLDAETDAKIREVISTDLAECTVIAVAQWAVWKKYADELYGCGDGKDVFGLCVQELHMIIRVLEKKKVKVSDKVKLQEYIDKLRVYADL